MSESRRRECLARQQHSAIFHNFHLIHCGLRYPINKHLLSGVSRFFYRFLICNPCARELELPAYPGDLSDVVDLLYGRAVRISTSNCRFLARVGAFLEIPRLESMARVIQTKTDTMVELGRDTEQLRSSGMPDEASIGRIASHFAEFCTSPLLLSASVELLQLVVNRPSLSVELFQLVLALVSFDCRKYGSLVQAINFSDLGREQRLTLLAARGVDLNQLRGALIPILRMSSGSFVKNRVFTVGEGLTGLLQFLRAQKRLVVSASSVFSQNFGLDQLLDIANGYSYFSTKTGPSEWIEFKFDGGHVQLTEYTLRGWKNSHAGVCPVSWILWGADRDREWAEIDRRTDEQALKQDGKEVRFQVTRLSQNCSRLKFQQLQTGNPFNGRLVLSGIEFFGIWRDSP
jgi:hypothetical protein